MGVRPSTFNDSLPPPAGLEPLTGPLDRGAAAHLLRRTSFSGSAEDVSELVGRDVSEAVDEIIYENRIWPQPSDPFWSALNPPPRSAPASVRSQYNSDNNGWVAECRVDWVKTMTKARLREKTTLFWHDHFATQISDYRYAFYAFKYLKLLRTNSLQYFHTFVRQVGITPAMLIYLNGNTNKYGKPNENYARELLELFSMGPVDAAGDPNYTESDIKELARALTGWVVSEDTGLGEFNVFRHDSEPVTVFGETYSSMDYNGVVDVIFDSRREAIAHFIARKLYGLFVQHQPDPDIVSGVAERLIQTNFATFDAIGLLLKSRHFFDDGVIGAQIKSPVEFVLQLVLSCGRSPSDGEFSRLERIIRLLEQELFNPPGVAGWPGHHDWITTNALPSRWIYADELLFGSGSLSRADLMATAAEVVDPGNEISAFLLPTELARHFIAVGPEHLPIPEVSDDFSGDLDRFPIPEEILSGPAYVRNLAKLFLAGYPWYEWSLNNRGANDRLLAFVRQLVRYPEYQLM